MTSALTEALVEVQKNLPTVGKDKTANVRSDKGNYSYKYADLGTVSDAILPLLAAQGLAWTAMPTLDGGDFVLAYKLMHESGETLEGRFPLAKGGTPQATGSAITYARRYALCSVIGLTPDEDDDGAEASKPPVNLRAYIFEALSKAERDMLSEAWAADYQFKSWAVPVEREEECRRLIDSYKGLAPDDVATSEVPPTQDDTIDLSDLIEPLSQPQRKQLAQDWQWKFGADAVPKGQEVEVRTIISQVQA